MYDAPQTLIRGRRQPLPHAVEFACKRPRHIHNFNLEEVHHGYATAKQQQTREIGKFQSEAGQERQFLRLRQERQVCILFRLEERQVEQRPQFLIVRHCNTGAGSCWLFSCPAAFFRLA
jgi:hypothetical protein